MEGRIVGGEGGAAGVLRGEGEGEEGGRVVVRDVEGVGGDDKDVGFARFGRSACEEDWSVVRCQRELLAGRTGGQ